jgi:hypothetical protein
MGVKPPVTAKAAVNRIAVFRNTAGIMRFDLELEVSI